MAKLTKTQIDELKNKGFITAVEPSDALANQSVDELKNKKYIIVTEPSADIEAAVTHGPTIYSFAGLQISSGPLVYENNSYVIKDGWNHASYGNVYGENDGSTYFNFIQMGKLFEKADFSENDGDIENLLDPFDGWRLPTNNEWKSIIGTTRAGSTVNGVSNKHYAFVKTAEETQSGYRSYGLILFPDDATITGRNLSGMDDNTVTEEVTMEEISVYLEQGCVFLPGIGSFSAMGWDDCGDCGYYASGTSSPENNNEYYYFVFESGGIYKDGLFKTTKTDNFNTIRLVKNV